MKVLYCIHSMINRGGTERILSVKANALAADYGYEVVVVTSHQEGKPLSFPLCSAVRHIDIGIDFYRHHLRRAFARAYEQLLMQEKPDICISLSNDDLYMLPAFKDGSIKLAEYHFSYERYYQEKSGLWGRLRAWNKNRKLRCAAAKMARFVLLTKADEARWKLPNSAQIYNPAYLDNQGLTANLESRHLVALGRLEAQKDFSQAIQAWEIVAKKHPDYVLDIYGEGSQRPLLEQLIQEKHLEGKVVLHPATQDVAGVLAQSCGLVMCSRFEGFPMTLVESLRFGLPMIAYDCPQGPAEIIENGKNGFLVPQGHWELLADAVISLIEHPDLRETMQQNALQTAQRFSMQHIMNQWDQLFKELYESKKNSGQS